MKGEGGVWEVDARSWMRPARVVFWLIADSLPLPHCLLFALGVHAGDEDAHAGH